MITIAYAGDLPTPPPAPPLDWDALRDRLIRTSFALVIERFTPGAANLSMRVRWANAYHAPPTYHALPRAQRRDALA